MSSIQIFPEDASLTSYFGWLDIEQQRYMFRIIDVDKNESNLRRAKLILSKPLYPILSQCEDTLQSMLLQSSTLDNFLVELDAIVRRMLSSVSNTSQRPIISNLQSNNSNSNAKLFSKVTDELSTIGWDRVRNVDDNFQQLELACTDNSGRSHIVQIELPSDYPKSPPICILNVPETNSKNNSSNSSTTNHTNHTTNNHHQRSKRTRTVLWVPGQQHLRAVLEQAKVWLSEYNTFWNEFDDFDANTWILEPVRPSRSDSLRRIALRKHCSVEITIKPDRPRDVCTCTFIGPEHIVADLRTAFHSGQRTWDRNLTVRNNMERILGQSFPSPATSSKSDFSVECGVCYAYRLDDGNGTTLLPDTTCESCGQHFHANCIGEWLQALPSTRRSFNVLFGNCPYCTRPISVQKS
tara:strand:+ start:1867 stop:3093 length:1227 start_codon:yes stop_codon:yes gene_type:complete